MILRPRLHRFEGETVRTGVPMSPAVPREQAAPPHPAARPEEPVDPEILGFPADVEDDDAGHAADAGGTAAVQAPPGSVFLVVNRRADRVAGVVLLLAGAAASASLWL